MRAPNQGARTITRASKPLRERVRRRLPPAFTGPRPLSSQRFALSPAIEGLPSFLSTAATAKARSLPPSRIRVTIASPRPTTQPWRGSGPIAHQKTRRLYMRRPFGHKRRVLAHAGPPPSGNFRMARELGAQCLGRDHRRRHDLRRRLSGERRVCAFGAGFVHHRAGLALAVLVAGSDAGAARARHHDDGDRRRVHRLRVACRLGFWARRRVLDR